MRLSCMWVLHTMKMPTLPTNIYNGPDAYKNLQFAWFNKTWENKGLSLLISQQRSAGFSVRTK
jgi:hypothetical protein